MGCVWGSAGVCVCDVSVGCVWRGMWGCEGLCGGLRALWGCAGVCEGGGGRVRVWGTSPSIPAEAEAGPVPPQTPGATFSADGPPSAAASDPMAHGPTGYGVSVDPTEPRGSGRRALLRDRVLRSCKGLIEFLLN